MRSWIAKLSAEGMGAGTLKNVVNTFKAALSAAVEAGLIVVSPAARVRLPHPVRAEKTFLTAEEVGRLAAAAPTEYRTLILFAAYSGLRAGEIAALRWERVDLRRATVEVVESYAEVHGELVLGPTKTYCRRTVRLPRFLCELLEEHQAADRRYRARVPFPDRRTVSALELLPPDLPPRGRDGGSSREPAVP